MADHLEERTIIDLDKTGRRHISVWTPWGTVPTDRIRLKGRRAVSDKRDIRAPARPARPRTLKN